jgi:hypothetical protein
MASRSPWLALVTSSIRRQEMRPAARCYWAAARPVQKRVNRPLEIITRRPSLLPSPGGLDPTIDRSNYDNTDIDLSSDRNYGAGFDRSFDRNGLIHPQ